MRFLLLLLTVLLIGCSGPHHPDHDSYKVVLDIGQGNEIPFTAYFTEDHRFEFYNAEEVVVSEEVEIRGDSIIIHHPVFEGVFKGRFTKSTIEGAFIKESLDRVVPFKMVAGNQPRFERGLEPMVNVTGDWETVFSPDSPEDRYVAKGIFEQKDGKVTGTFRTTTGDYRYLEGVVDGDSLKLSTFDHAHAFVFVAKVTDSTMNGMFYSGNHFEEPFTAVLNNNYQLPNEEALTYLKEGYDSLEFSFPDEDGNVISLEDEQFKEKVVVVQIMGTWCPNCLDETRFLASYFNEDAADDVAIVALAFEYARTSERAFEGIKRLKSKMNVNYPVLLAQYGTESKLEAAKKLPMLNHVLSYPTTIFIDKEGKVRKIHTGFNGPATGALYIDFIKDFDATIQQLRTEP